MYAEIFPAHRLHVSLSFLWCLWVKISLIGFTSLRSCSSITSRGYWNKYLHALSIFSRLQTQQSRFFCTIIISHSRVILYILFSGPKVELHKQDNNLIQEVLRTSKTTVFHSGVHDRNTESQSFTVSRIIWSRLKTAKVSLFLKICKLLRQTSRPRTLLRIGYLITRGSRMSAFESAVMVS